MGAAAYEPDGRRRWHLLIRERSEADGTWQAWVSWVQQTGGRRVPNVAQILAGGLRPRGLPEACQQVPGRVCAAVLSRSAIPAPGVTARGGMAG